MINLCTGYDYQGAPLKGTVHQKNFYRSSLIFWIVMRSGIADLGERGLSDIAVKTHCTMGILGNKKFFFKPCYAFKFDPKTILHPFKNIFLNSSEPQKLCSNYFVCITI